MSDRYSVEETADALERFVLHDHAARASVTLAPSRGGLVTRFSVGGEPVLFLDDASLRDTTKNVRGGVPVLFPFGGPLAGDRLELSGATMKQHGFARNLAWSAEAEGASVTMRVLATEATKVVYSFDFALVFTVALRDGALVLQQRYENRGSAPMPIAPGLHPYFALPDGKKKHARVTTNATRQWDNVTKTTGPFTGLDLSAAEVDLHLLDHGPRETRLVRPGMRDVILRFGADQESLVIWTVRGKDFVCVEPWTRTANALNEGRGIVVAPGAVHETALTISLA